MMPSQKIKINQFNKIKTMNNLLLTKISLMIILSSIIIIMLILKIFNKSHKEFRLINSNNKFLPNHNKIIYLKVYLFNNNIYNLSK